MRKSNFYIIATVLIILLFCCGNSYAQSNAQSDSVNENNNSLSLGISGPPEVTENIRSSPNVPNLPYTELPSYFGPFEKTWNDQSNSILPFVLMSNRDYTITNPYHIPFTNNKNSKINITKIGIKKKYEKVKNVKVLNGIRELNGIKYKSIITIVAYGGRKITTMDCFTQAVIEAGNAGGNVFLLLSASSSPGTHSSTVGIGSSGAGNFSQGGKEAYSGGAATGFASNTGGPTSNPFIHGVALLVTQSELKKVKILSPFEK